MIKLPHYSPACRTTMLRNRPQATLLESALTDVSLKCDCLTIFGLRGHKFCKILIPLFASYDSSPFFSCEFLNNANFCHLTCETLPYRKNICKSELWIIPNVLVYFCTVQVFSLKKLVQKSFQRSLQDCFHLTNLAGQNFQPHHFNRKVVGRIVQKFDPKMWAL